MTLLRKQSEVQLVERGQTPLEKHVGVCDQTGTEPFVLLSFPSCTIFPDNCLLIEEKYTNVRNKVAHDCVTSQ